MLFVSNQENDEAAEFDPEKLRLINELRFAKARLAALELEILNGRDHAIGQTAELATVRHELATVRHGLAAVRQELVAVRSSTTWKIGRCFMLPIRVLRRIGRR
ncbi:MAG: hypothetical protein RLZZ170_282 [Actinomycetota bacterium]